MFQTESALVPEHINISGVLTKSVNLHTNFCVCVFMLPLLSIQSVYLLWTKLIGCHIGNRQAGDLMLKPESCLLISSSLRHSDLSLFAFQTPFSSLRQYRPAFQSGCFRSNCVFV